MMNTFWLYFANGYVLDMLQFCNVSTGTWKSKQAHKVCIRGVTGLEDMHRLWIWYHVPRHKTKQMLNSCVLFFCFFFF